MAEPASPAHRTPILLLRFSGSFLLRFDTRAFLVLLSHEPPRSASGIQYRRKNFRRGFAARRGKRQKGKENQSPTHRTPIKLPRFPGPFLLRFDTRASPVLRFHEPPRSARFCPLEGPTGSVSDLA